VTLVTADRSSQIQELRIAFLKKLQTFERLQAVYMPGIAVLREAAEERCDPDLLPPKAEDIKLWLPSDIPAATRRTACARGIPEWRPNYGRRNVSMRSTTYAPACTLRNILSPGGIRILSANGQLHGQQR
jgi:hypothetical protein